MSKWTRTRRDPGRTYIDQEAKKRDDRMVARMSRFLDEGTAEDEPSFVEAIKEEHPDISKEKLKKLIMQFRDVISERQRRDQGRR